MIFNSGLEDLLILKPIDKLLFLPAVILVCDPIDISYLNSILMSGDCVGERQCRSQIGSHTKVLVLKIIEIPSFGRYGVFFWKNGSVG